MKYHELTTASKKSPKRVGRGMAAGQGKTAGRGTKGQMARTGSSRRPGFEGGQNPLMQRLPKLHGFHSTRTRFVEVYTGQLDQFTDKTVDTSVLAEHGLIENRHANVKLLVNGDITKKVTVKLQAASASAIQAVEKAGGSFEKVERVMRSASQKKTERKAAKAKA